MSGNNNINKMEWKPILPPLPESGMEEDETAGISEGGLQSLSSSSEGNGDPIAELLSWSEARRPTINAELSDTTTLKMGNDYVNRQKVQHLKMELQIARQQLKMVRQQLEKIPRSQVKDLTILHELDSSSIMTSSDTSDIVNDDLSFSNLQDAQTPIEERSKFLLNSVLENEPVEVITDEQRAERSMFVQQLLLSTIAENKESQAIKLGGIREKNRFRRTTETSVSKQDELQTMCPKRTM